MKFKNKEIEILAPAGNLETLKVAAALGSDAVYLGVGNFNARRNAENFNYEQLEEGIKYCHVLDKKVFVTLNTLIYDKEISSLYEEATKIARLGVDAFIVQDLGVASIIKECIPKATLHASTQLSAHNVSDCLALEDFGFKRVVLSRELSFKEIEKITSKTKIETEVFIHGALCMSVSGQCYFSSILGNRSGNRGLCAGVCRLPFYVNEKDNYNLSLKDLCAIDLLDKLAQINVTSGKIEGRMKGKEYVTNVLKAIKDKSEFDTFDKKLLERTFSRGGFTNGYLQGYLGNSMFGVRSADNKESTKEVLKEAKGIKEENNLIPLNIQYSFSLGKKGEIAFTDEKDNSVRVTTEILEEAKNKPLTYEAINNQLSKLKDSPYYINNISGEINGDIFLALSQINELRRKGIDQLNNIRNKREEVKIAPLKKLEAKTKKQDKKEKLIIYLKKAEMLNEEILNKVDFAVLPLLEVKKLLKEEFISKFSDRITVEAPRVYFDDEEKLIEDLRAIKEKDISTLLCHTLGKLKIGKDLGFDLMGGLGLNTLNSYSIDYLQKEYNLKRIFLSFEINKNDIKKLNTLVPITVMGYGNFPVMISRNCPIKLEVNCKNCGGINYLTDRMNKKFMVMCTKDYVEVFNLTPIYLADVKDEISGVDFYLYFTCESKKEILSLIEKFKNKEKIGEFSRGGFLKKIL